MLLSVQQKYILEVLRKLGCVRQDQLHALVRGKFQRPDFEISDSRMTAMLRQLRSGLGDFHVDGNFVYLARDQPDAARLEAIDVMLELSEGAPQGFNVKVDSPRLLRFVLGGDRDRPKGSTFRSAVLSRFPTNPKRKRRFYRETDRTRAGTNEKRGHRRGERGCAG